MNRITYGSSLKTGAYYLRTSNLERVFASRIREVIAETKARAAGYSSHYDYFYRDHNRPYIFVSGKKAGAGWINDALEGIEIPTGSIRSNEEDLKAIISHAQDLRLLDKKEAFVESLTMILSGMLGHNIAVVEEGYQWGKYSVNLKIGNGIRLNLVFSE